MSPERANDYSVIVDVKTVRRHVDGRLGAWDVLATSSFDVQSLTIDDAAYLGAAVREVCRLGAATTPARD